MARRPRRDGEPADNIWVVTNKHVVEPKRISMVAQLDSCAATGNALARWSYQKHALRRRIPRCFPDPEIDALPVAVRNTSRPPKAVTRGCDTCR